jgi:Ca2+-binding RTX toxin-like protein
VNPTVNPDDRSRVGHHVKTFLAATALVIGAIGAPPASAAAETCFGLVPTIVGTPGDDTLIGTDGPDVIVGLDGDDTISGLGGADRLCGGAGQDFVNAGGGGDRVDGGEDADSLFDRQGSALLAGGPGDDLITTSLKVRAEGIRAVDGGDGVDDLVIQHVWEGVGTLGRPVGLVNLRTGVIRAETRGPTTTTIPVAGIEDVEVNDGHWTLVGDAQDNELRGGHTQNSHVVIHAGGGDDSLTGTRHDDLLDGGKGFDRATRTGGHDTYVSVERVR